MATLYNIYCDESCHLENDKKPIMALGATYCPQSEAHQLARKISQLKSKHNAKGELKWTKVSSAKEDFYLELINVFFTTSSLNFRSLVVINKVQLNHQEFNQGSHDTFYYKMFFSLLNKILDPKNRYNIYLDIKDTRSRRKINNLKNILCRNVYDFTSEMIQHIQNIHSYESDLMQLSDFLLGAVSYRNRNLKGVVTKNKIIHTIEQHINHPLTSSTSLYDKKFNLFIYTPRRSL